MTRIRLLEPAEADAEAVLEMWRAAEATPSVTDSADDIQRVAAREQVAFLVAEVDGRIVGSVIATFDGWRGNIYRLAVHPAHRRRGVARQLVARAQEALASWGVRRVTALVEREHDWALEFWNAVGFAHDARIARFVLTVEPQDA